MASASLRPHYTLPGSPINPYAAGAYLDARMTTPTAPAGRAR